MFAEFINQYGPVILYAILTAIGGYLGMVAKKLVTKYLNTKTKKEIAKTVVLAVQQLYKNLSGEEKLTKAMEAAEEMLAEAGIKVTALELRMLLEAAVGEFKEAFNKEPEAETPATPEISA